MPTQVLGFKEVPRPELGFSGRWLVGLGFMVHIIAADPSVPRRFSDWKEQYAASEPEAWFIRRGPHVGTEGLGRMQPRMRRPDPCGQRRQSCPSSRSPHVHHPAFEVADIDATERQLRAHGVEYSRHVLPDVDMRQLFFYDPEG